MIYHVSQNLILIVQLLMLPEKDGRIFLILSSQAGSFSSFTVVFFNAIRGFSEERMVSTQTMLNLLPATDQQKHVCTGVVL